MDLGSAHVKQKKEEVNVLEWKAFFLGWMKLLHARKIMHFFFAHCQKLAIYLKILKFFTKFRWLNLGYERNIFFQVQYQLLIKTLTKYASIPTVQTFFDLKKCLSVLKYYTIIDIAFTVRKLAAVFLFNQFQYQLFYMHIFISFIIDILEEK